MTAVEEELAALKRRIGELEVALKARTANPAPPAEAAALGDGVRSGKRRTGRPG